MPLLQSLSQSVTASESVKCNCFRFCHKVSLLQGLSQSVTASESVKCHCSRVCHSAIASKSVTECHCFSLSVSLLHSLSQNATAFESVTKCHYFKVSHKVSLLQCLSQSVNASSLLQSFTVLMPSQSVTASRSVIKCTISMSV